MPIDRTEIVTTSKGLLRLERYGMEFTRDEARRLRDNIDRELNRASGAAEPVEEMQVPSPRCRGKGSDAVAG